MYISLENTILCDNTIYSILNQVQEDMGFPTDIVVLTMQQKLL